LFPFAFAAQRAVCLALDLAVAAARAGNYAALAMVRGSTMMFRCFTAGALLALIAAGPVLAQSNKVPTPQEAMRQSQEALPLKAQKTFPNKVQWLAVSLNGKPFSGDRPAFLLDDQLRARGFGGCNTYSAGAYPIGGQRFAVGPIAMTKKTCDKEVMELERQFLLALRTSQAWDTQGGYLILKGQGGEIKFERTL
jgi:heat shock protein HslJ